MAGIGDRQHGIAGTGRARGHRLAQVMRETRNPAAAGRVIPEKRNA